MINILRKNQKALWIVIAVLCIPFVFYFVQRPDYGAAFHSGDLGKVYDHPVSRIEFQHNARLFMLARELGMFTFLQDLVGNAQSENEAYADFTFNRLILEHEADRLGLRPSRQQIINLLKGLRPFQGDKGGFEPAKYDEFTQTVLPSMGFNESHVEELAADQLILQQVKDLIGTGVQVAESETKEDYDRAYGKLSVAVVRLPSDQLAQGIQVSDDDIAKYYEAHKPELNTDEKRKVSFVSFALNEEQKKLTGKERVEVLQKLADRANDFNQALLEKGADFDQVAAKFEAPVQVTGEFTKAAPDPALNANPQLATTAFQLSPNEPNSDALQVADGFFVLHLVGIEPARPLTLEEARPKIVDAIKKDRTREMLASKAAEAAGKIREALKNGTAFDAAMNASGLPVEKLPPFGLADQPKMKPAEPGKPAEPEPQPADMNLIKGAIAELNPGEVSEFVPTESGGLIAAVEKREPADSVAYEAVKAMFNMRTVRSRRDIAFYDWLRERRREAGVPETSQVNLG
jgi:peptidyl-prolyl cis-trans isomerase D